MIVKWWVVWNECHGKPTYKHGSREDAIREAKRLAGIYRGSQFHVLEYVGTAERVDIVFTPAEDSERDPSIPF